MAWETKKKRKERKKGRTTAESSVTDEHRTPIRVVLSTCSTVYTVLHWSSELTGH